MPTQRKKRPAGSGEWYVAGYDFGDYLHGSTDPQTRAKELEDIISAQAGDQEAWGRLVAANVRYAIKFSEWLLRARPKSLPIEDAVQCSLMGLTVAVKKFDTSSGLRLLTYATRWMRAMIDNHVADYFPVRVPRYQWQPCSSMYNGSKFKKEAARAIGTVSEVDLADPSDWNEAFLAKTPDHRRGVADELADREEFEKKSAALRGWFFESLDARDRHLVAKRYGLDGSPRQVAADMGLDLGISKQRVFQLEQNAMRKLKRAAKAGV